MSESSLKSKIYNYIWFILCTLVLIGFLLVGVFLFQPQKHITLTVSLNGCTVSTWQNEDSLYLFLPGWAELDQVTWSQHVTINEKTYRAGDSLNGLEADRSYELKRNNHTFRFNLIQTSELPAMFIDTATGKLDYLKQDKNNQEKGQLRLLDADGNSLLDSPLEWISGRGNMTWTLDKKGWGFKLPAPASLLGMAPNTKWVLLANAFEATRGLRNYAAYKMAIETGLEYARDVRFLDLYLNGEYAGLYILAERIDEGENALNIGNLDQANAEANSAVRLNIDKALIQKEFSADGYVGKSWTNLKSPKDISGGYILERNYESKLDDKPYQFATGKLEHFVIRYPSLVTRDEADYISARMQQVENALFNPDYIDPESGLPLSQLIDLDSWAKRFLVDEASKNEGMAVTSSYYYKKQGDDAIYCGPVWDYDKSFGTFRTFQNPIGLTYGGMHFNYSPWLKRFYDHPEAQLLIRQYYADLVHPYLQSLVQGRLREWSQDIISSYQADWLRWQQEYESYTSIAFQENGCPGSLDAAVEFMEDWIQQRMDFLDEIWIKNQVYYNIIDPDGDTVYVLPAGSDISELGQQYGSDYVDRETGLMPDYSQPLQQDYKLVYHPSDEIPEPTTSISDTIRVALRKWIRWLATPVLLLFAIWILCYQDWKRYQR